MFIIEMVKINIRENKSRIFLNVFICLSIVFLLCVYDKNISDEKEELKHLAEVLPVSGNITNLNGSQMVSLAIKDQVIQELKQSPLIKDFNYTIPVMAGIGEFSLEQWKDNLTINIVGTNTIAGIPGLHKEDIHLVEGEKADVLQSDRDVCIAEEAWLQKNHFEVGDTLSLNEFYYDYEDALNPKLHPLVVKDYLIIGTMDVSQVVTNGIVPNILLPVENIRKSLLDSNLEFYADSASFTLRDPLQLNHFKTQMKGLGLMETIATADYSTKGNALILNDSTFSSAANQLQQSIALYEKFFPIILVMAAIAGYVIAYLLVQNRRRELAIMRSLGCRRRQCVWIVIMEHVLASLFGMLLGTILMVLLYQYVINPYILFGAAAVYLLGTLIAVWKYSRVNLMLALAQAD